MIVDLVPNHCSSDHPLFQQALAAAPGSPERDLFIFRDGRGPGRGGAAEQLAVPVRRPGLDPGAGRPVVPAPVRLEPAGLELARSPRPGHVRADPAVLAGPGHRRVPGGRRARPVQGPRTWPTWPTPTLTNRPSAYYHRPEVHQVYRSWRAILDSYPADGFPGARTAVGEVWADSPATLRPYLAPDGLPQVVQLRAGPGQVVGAGAAGGDRRDQRRSPTARARPG